MSPEQLIHYYSLRLDPFRTGELEPSTDEQMYVKVDGFAKESGRIKTLAPQLQPLSLVLVCGPAGCGRSSMVNFTIRNLPPPPDGVSLVRVVGQVRDEQEMEGVRQALESMRTMMRKKKAFAQQDDLRERYEKYIADSKPNDAPPMGKCKDIFSDSLTVLEELKIKPAVVVEGVLKYTQVQQAATAFEEADVLLFTTMQEDIFNKFATHHYPGFQAQVDVLDLPDIEEFLMQRWRYATNNAAAVHPFDTGGIKAAFEGRKWSFRSVNDIIWDVWQMHRERTPPTAPPAAIISENVILRAAVAYSNRGGVTK